MNSVADDPSFEIPLQLRELAEKNIELAQEAFRELWDAARLAQDMTAAMLPTSAANATLKKLLDRAMMFTQRNAEASFALARELANARDFPHVLQIQCRFAQDQIQIYSQQAQELGRLMAEVAQNAQVGR